MSQKTRRLALVTLAAALTITAVPSRADFIRGGATLSSVSSVVKISRVGHGLDKLTEGEILYIFTENGEPVAQIVVKEVFADEIHSEPLPSSVARAIRESNAILVFSNLREYGDFIRAYLEGTTEAFINFITRYPKSELRHEAQRVIDGIVYRPYKIQGTVAAFDSFLKNYPENYYSDNARERRDQILYEEARQVARIHAYRRFLREYPGNLFVEQAESMIAAIRERYLDTTAEELAREPRKWLGRDVEFSANLHSALPVYVEGFSVGRKTAGFTSPRNSSEHLNIQVESGPYVLWRVFIDRDKLDLVDMVERSEKGARVRVYGNIFDISGGAPWIEVQDLELL